MFYWHPPTSSLVLTLYQQIRLVGHSSDKAGLPVDEDEARRTQIEDTSLNTDDQLDQLTVLMLLARGNILKYYYIASCYWHPNSL